MTLATIDYAHWLSQNWFEAVQTLGIMTGLIFTTVAVRSASKSTRISNLFLITEHHRDIWKLLLSNPELGQAVLAERLPTQSITDSERLFVTLLILHVSACFEADKAGALTPIEGFAADVGGLLSRPTPALVWEQLRPLQNSDFAKWVDEAVRAHSAKS